MWLLSVILFLCITFLSETSISSRKVKSSWLWPLGLSTFKVRPPAQERPRKDPRGEAKTKLSDYLTSEIVIYSDFGDEKEEPVKRRVLRLDDEDDEKSR